MTIEFPKLTQAEIDAHKPRIWQDVYAVTVCECGSEDFGFRLGCNCGGNVEWFWKTHDDRYLTEADVCILPNCQRTTNR